MIERAASETMRERVSCGSQLAVVWYSILQARKVKLLSQWHMSFSGFREDVIVFSLTNVRPKYQSYHVVVKVGKEMIVIVCRCG